MTDRDMTEMIPDWISTASAPILIEATSAQP
jgi:hypothetical protein